MTPFDQLASEAATLPHANAPEPPKVPAERHLGSAADRCGLYRGCARALPGHWERSRRQCCVGNTRVAVPTKAASRNR
jgi:hypothetical protein